MDSRPAASGRRCHADARRARRDSATRPDNLTRLYLSRHRRAAERLRAWIGRGWLRRAYRCGSQCRWAATGPPTARPVLRVAYRQRCIDAGRFDGSLGVVAAILAVVELARRGIALPFAIEIPWHSRRRECALSHQPSEAPRQSPAAMDPRWLEVCDDDGVTCAGAAGFRWRSRR